MSAPLVAMNGIVKTFPGVRALDAVDFSVRAGEIHALLGENGAGKSTLINVLTGVLKRDGGTIKLKGASINPMSPSAAQQLGVSSVHQEVNLVLGLTVMENVLLGFEPRTMGVIRWRTMRKRARVALDRLNLELDADAPLGAYPLPIQQMVAIARALWLDASVLVLDEPTSSLDAAETERLFDVLRGLRDDGMSVIFITHFLDQVYAVSDRMTVLRNGRLVGTFDPETLPRLKLIEQMIGRAVVEAGDGDGALNAHEESAPRGAPVLEARKMKRRGAIVSADLELSQGEVVGLAGLLGSGRSEIVRALFGVDALDEGTVTIGGRAFHRMSPRKAIRHGMALTPENRREAGIIADLSVRENIILALQATRPWWRRINRRAQQAISERYITLLGVDTPDADKPVGQLSGGNQQKVILARWMLMEPAVLMLDEPTRGIDVGARAEIESLIKRLSADGVAIIVISSELEELERICQRVLVLRDRCVVGALRGAKVTVDRMMRMIAATAEGRRAAHA